MKPPPFDYVVADSVESAVDLLRSAGDDAKLLAGGQSLVPLMNFRLARPSLLIDVNRIPRLADIGAGADAIRIGALVRHRKLERSPTLASHLPVLSEAAGWIAHPQVRTRGTIGGSIAHADASAELPVVLAALEAVATIQSPGAVQEIPVPDLVAGHFLNTLAQDEMITGFEIPRLPPGSGSAFAEFARRHGDYAIGGAVSIVTLDRGRCTRARIVALGGGPCPVRCTEAETALIGTSVSAADAAAAAESALPSLSPMATAHGSPGYRRQVIASMIRRTVTTAAERARSSR
ncbi:FAD binding domain-containing protein [Amycolatopsis sp. NPDC059090]|uniref:FAD binding domain-containing protein n=1 Tax=unclassified Amycolatopsis TaxID=2618356 RepID=UPI003671DFA7